MLTNPTIQVQIHVYQGEDEENLGYSEGLEGYSDSSQGMPDLEYRCCYKFAIIQLAIVGEDRDHNEYYFQESRERPTRSCFSCAAEQ